jgi:RNA polymerase sigma-70 factor (ECF subfamily)
MAESDGELAAGFIARTPAAFSAAYQKYARVLYAVARNALGNGAAAEDCVHDALLRVWQTPGSYRAERGSLRTFLIACVRNEAMTTLRSTSRRAAREEKAARLEPVRAAEIAVVDHVEAARVRDAVMQLPHEQRAALDLVYFGHRSQAQAAAELGVPLGTIKSRLSVAIRRLHETLGARDGT